MKRLLDNLFLLRVLWAAARDFRAHEDAYPGNEERGGR